MVLSGWNNILPMTPTYLRLQEDILRCDTSTKASSLFCRAYLLFSYAILVRTFLMSYRDCSFGKVLYKCGSLICFYYFSCTMAVIVYTVHRSPHAEDTLSSMFMRSVRKHKKKKKKKKRKWRKWRKWRTIIRKHKWINTARDIKKIKLWRTWPRWRSCWHSTVGNSVFSDTGKKKRGIKVTKV